jgi:phosphosulfolactate phosphohydrolase-like enzyme
MGAFAPLLMRTLSIRNWSEPLPNKGIAVVFDIFRCTSTLHCLYSRKPKRLFVGQSLAEIREAKLSFTKEAQIFSELSQEIECAERFDNSPNLALTKPLQHRILVATTTGTPAMFAARKYRKVILGSFLNFSALVQTLSNLEEPITLLPAAPPQWKHSEDEAAAQSVATALEGFSDNAEFVRKCAESGKAKIHESTRVTDLIKKLPYGKEDTDASLDIDRFSFVLELDFEASPHPLIARVQEYNA